MVVDRGKGGSECNGAVCEDCKNGDREDLGEAIVEQAGNLDIECWKRGGLGHVTREYNGGPQVVRYQRQN